MMATNWPAGISRSMPRSTRLAPKSFSRPLTRIVAAPAAMTRSSTGASLISTARKRSWAKTFIISSSMLIDRVPAERPAFKSPGDDIGQLAEHGVDNQRQDNHVGHHELAGIVGHMA